MGKNKAISPKGANMVPAKDMLLPAPFNARQLPIDLRAVPLEPRVMLDANLEFDINASTALTSVLSGVAQLFDEQIDEITSFLDTFDETASSALDKISAFVDTAEDVNSSTGEVVDLSVATETVQRIRDAIEELRSKVDGSIGDLIDGDFSADVAADVRNQLETFINNADPDPDSDFVSDLSTAQIEAIYTAENFTAGTVDSALDTLIGSMTLSNGVATATAADVKTMFHDAVATAMGLSTGNFSVALEDITAGGETLVTFTQDGDFAVDVDVNLPQAFADFQALLQSAIPGISLPFDVLSQGADDSLISFEIETETTFNGDILDRLAVNIHEFAFAPLLEVGGAITGVAGAGFNLGLLALEVTALETAQF
ncbi:MAG: hypothetical protein ACPGUX_08195, partial [Halocynthiibacter sp.]